MVKGILVVCVVAGVLVFAYRGCDAEATAQRNFDKVEIGMAHERVREIFRVKGAPSPARETHSFVTTEIKFFVPPGNEEQYVEITFDEEGKVSAKKKVGF